MTIDKLQEQNKNLTVLSIQSRSALFTRVDTDFADMVALSAKLTMEKRNSYIADDGEALSLSSVKQARQKVFGELPIQAGWCYGGNRFMNGMEWHKSSEIVVACTNCVLLLGSYFDIVNDVYHSKNAVALYLEKGQAVELMPMTLHLAPLPIGESFVAGIILPKGTNLALSEGISGTLRAVNKWLLVHEDNIEGVKSGSKVGISGENITLNI